jgi:hypothetical protein
VEKNYLGIESPYDLMVEQKFKLYKLDTKSREITSIDPVPNSLYGNFSVSAYKYSAISPDGKWFAYILDNKDRSLALEPMENVLENKHDHHIEWKRYGQLSNLFWLNNETISTFFDLKKDKIAPTLVINPFTQAFRLYQIENFPNYYPLLHKISITPFAFDTNNISSDPTMTRAVYIAGGTDEPVYLVVWDAVQNKEIVRISGFALGDGTDPLWSFDGSDFVILLDQTNWYQVTRDGKVKQLTRFDEFLKGRPRFLTPSRSQDGRYLTFMASLSAGKDDEVSKYLVIDLQAEPVDGFCIQSLPYKKFGMIKPIWSPDNKYLAVSVTDHNGKGDLLVVDVNQKRVYPLGKDATGFGWIIKK